MPNCDIRFSRVDTRIVHGQVVGPWTAQFHIKRVIVIDAAIAADPFMSGFYRRMRMKGFKVDIQDPLVAAESWKRGSFGEQGMATMLIFPSIAQAHAAFQAGLGFGELNLGNQTGAPDKRMLCPNIFASAQEFGMLREVAEGGVRVFAQLLPSG